MSEIGKIIHNYKVIQIPIQNTKKATFIGDSISKIYVINLRNNVLRRNYITRLLKNYKINYDFIIVEKVTTELYESCVQNKTITRSEFGCMLSHLWCLRDIIKNQYKNAIILEDDIIFHKNFLPLFKNIYNPSYHFLILGACDFSFSTHNYKHVKNGLYTIDSNSKKVYGAHANYYSLKGAMKMYELKTTSEVTFFDKDYINMFSYFKETAFICYPNLIVTDISTSNLDHIYPFGSIAEQNYYKKCFIHFVFKEYHFIYLDIIEKNKNIPIQDHDTYETYWKRIIYLYFHNEALITEITQRVSFDLFTIKDLQYIMNNI